MKSFIFLYLVFFTTQALFSQDIIVKKNGEVLSVYNIDESSNWIYYTTETNPNSQTFKIKKDEIFTIRKEGDAQKKGNAPTQIRTNQTVTINKPAKSNAPADENNKKLIELYNQKYRITGLKSDDKPAHYGFCVMGVSDYSILSNEDIEIRFVQCNPQLLGNNWAGYQTHFILNPFYIEVLNKTQQTLYIDLGNCFRIYEDGNYTVYFDAQETTITEGNNRGMGLALGSISNILGIGGTVGNLMSGLSVGGGKLSAISKTYAKQRILAIPPLAKNAISKNEYVQVKKYEFEHTSEAELFTFYLPRKILRGEEVNYTLENSPYKVDYLLTYSNSESFSNYKNIKFGIYINKIVGTYQNDIIDPKAKSENFWDDITEHIIGYNKFTIIGYGTFYKE